MRAPIVDLSAPEPGEVLVVECECGRAPILSAAGVDVVLHRTGCLVGVLDGLAGLAQFQQVDRAAGARSCRACGCTEGYACPGGCSWVELDVCSVCVVIGAAS